MDKYEYSMQEPQIPDKSKALENKTNYCEQDTTNKSAYARARQSERLQLKTSLVDYFKKKNIQDLSPDFVCFIPNAKYVWAHKVIMDALKDDSINPCDAALLKNMWMNKDAALSLKNFLDRLKTDVNVLPHTNYPTKSGLKPTCDKAGNLTYALKNPGYFNMYTGEREDYPTYEEMYNASNVYMGKPGWRPFLDKDRPSYHKNPKEPCCSDCENGGECQEEQEKARLFVRNWDKLVNHTKNALYQHYKDETEDVLLEQEDIDPKYMNLIKQLQEMVLSKRLVSSSFKKIVGDLAAISHEQKNIYAASLLFPWNVRTARIPNTIPVPSATFTLASNINLTTNALGNVAFCFNPFALYDPGSPNSSTFAINNNVSLNGAASNNFFLATAIGQVTPATFYSRYRLVSAGWRITYTASTLSTSGFCTTSVSYINVSTGTVGSSMSEYSQFGDFTVIENGQFKATISGTAGNKIENIYLPPDEDYTKFVSINGAPLPYVMTGYITSAPVSTTVARLDIICNFESIVNNQFTDYIPTSTYGGGQQESSRAFKAVTLLNNVKDMGETARKDVLKSVSPSTDNTITGDSIIKLPPSRAEIKKDKGIMDYVGDLFTDVAKTAITTFLPFGGNFLKNMIFPEPVKTAIGPTVTESDFPDVPKAIIKYNSKRRPLMTSM